MKLDSKAASAYNGIAPACPCAGNCGTTCAKTCTGCKGSCVGDCVGSLFLVAS